MMDDCIMDSKPFGYISADPSKGELNGWSQPSDHGVLCYVRDYEESGSNLIIEVEATTAFSVKNVIQPVLPSLVDGERFPGVEELMEEAGLYPEEVGPAGNSLDLRADVEVLELRRRPMMWTMEGLMMTCIQRGLSQTSFSALMDICTNSGRNPIHSAGVPCLAMFY